MPGLPVQTNTLRWALQAMLSDTAYAEGQAWQAWIQAKLDRAPWTDTERQALGAHAVRWATAQSYETGVVLRQALGQTLTEEERATLTSQARRANVARIMQHFLLENTPMSIANVEADVDEHGTEAIEALTGSPFEQALAQVAKEMEAPPYHDPGLGNESLLVKALALIHEGKVQPRGDGSWLVQGKNGTYTVGGGACTCKAGRFGTGKCSHLLATVIMERTLKRLPTPAPPLPFGPTTADERLAAIPPKTAQDAPESTIAPQEDAEVMLDTDEAGGALMDAEDEQSEIAEDTAQEHASPESAGQREARKAREEWRLEQWRQARQEWLDEVHNLQLELRQYQKAIEEGRLVAAPAAAVETPASMGPAPAPSLTLPLRSWHAICADLSKPIPPQCIKQKQQGRQTIDYLAWYTVREILDAYAPGWNSYVRKIQEVTTVIGRSEELKSVKAWVMVYGITIPCAEGLMRRESTGLERENEPIYGDTMTNAEATGFKRCAAKFGIGADLYEKDERDEFIGTALQAEQGVLLKRLRHELTRRHLPARDIMAWLGLQTGARTAAAIPIAALKAYMTTLGIVETDAEPRSEEADTVTGEIAERPVPPPVAETTPPVQAPPPSSPRLETAPTLSTDLTPAQRQQRQEIMKTLGQMGFKGGPLTAYAQPVETLTGLRLVPDQFAEILRQVKDLCASGKRL